MHHRYNPTIIRLFIMIHFAPFLIIIITPLRRFRLLNIFISLTNHIDFTFLQLFFLSFYISHITVSKYLYFSSTSVALPLILQGELRFRLEFKYFLITILIDNIAQSDTLTRMLLLQTSLRSISLIFRYLITDLIHGASILFSTLFRFQNIL